jgi:hypothetical protein
MQLLPQHVVIAIARWMQQAHAMLEAPHNEPVLLS